MGGGWKIDFINLSEMVDASLAFFGDVLLTADHDDDDDDGGTHA